MGVKAALIVVTAGAGAYYVYTMMTSSEPASRTMDVPHLTASSASAAHPVAIEASVPEAPPPAPEPKPMPTAKLIPAGIAYPPTAADKRPIFHKGGKAVTRAPAPRPMKPMQHWLEAHQLA